MLSRWRTLQPDEPEGPVPLKTMAVFANPHTGYCMLTNQVIKDRQVVLMSGRGVEETPLGPARWGKDGVYRVR